MNRQIKKINNIEIDINFWLNFELKSNRAGVKKIVIIIKLNANNPTMWRTWITSVAQEKLYAHKFHGKPVKIVARTQSEKAKELENRKIEAKFIFK